MSSPLWGRTDCVSTKREIKSGYAKIVISHFTKPGLSADDRRIAVLYSAFQRISGMSGTCKASHRLSATTEDVTGDDQHADSADKTDIKKPLPEQEAVFLSGKHPLTGSGMQAFSLPAQQMPHRARLQLHRYPRSCGISARPADRISPSHRSKRPVLPFARGKPSGVF